MRLRNPMNCSKCQPCSVWQPYLYSCDDGDPITWLQGIYKPYIIDISFSDKIRGIGRVIDAGSAYSRRIKRARKWEPRAREKLERGRCGFELFGSHFYLKKTPVAVQEITVGRFTQCFRVLKPANGITSCCVYDLLSFQWEIYNNWIVGWNN